MNFSRFTVAKLTSSGGFVHFFCFVFLLPISVIGGSHASNTIAIVPSDLLAALISATIILFGVKFSRRELLFPLILLFTVYSFVLASSTTMHNGSLTPLLSFVKFCKVILAFLAGYAFSFWFGRDRVLRALSNASVAYLSLLFISQFIYHADFRPRLGESFFDFPVYGFPNSPSAYVVYLLCIALVSSRSALSKYGLLAIAAVFAAGSLSRNALVQITLATIAFSIDSPKKIFQSIGVIIMGTGTFVLFDIGSTFNLASIMDGISRRFESAQQSGDFSNGRLNIFKETIELVSSKPLFGYAFDSFSLYGSHGTPHNQYLEVLFKTGAIGLVWYMIILILCVYRILKSNIGASLSPKGLYVMLALVSVSNLAQPNLSYSVTGNVVFFIFGLFAILPNSREIELIKLHEK